MKDWPPDEETLTRLFDEKKEALVQHASRFIKDEHLAEDAVQDAARKVFADLEKSLASIKGNPASWLFGVVRHAAFDIIRKQTRKSFKLEFHGDDRGSGDDGKVVPFGADKADENAVQPDHAAETSERKTLVEQMLASLSPMQRKIVRLYYFEGLLQPKIAELLHVPKNTVKMALRSIRSVLRTSFATKLAALKN